MSFLDVLATRLPNDYLGDLIINSYYHPDQKSLIAIVRQTHEILVLKNKRSRVQFESGFF